MNTLISGKQVFRILTFTVFSMILFSSCEVEDYYVYGINDIEITPVNSEKDKAKTEAQYISILYTNLFQKAIESIGDKQIAFDMLVSKYMNDPEVKLPTDESMRENPEQFVRNTYSRFYVRQPTEAELQWMINYIESRPALTTELVYFSFATSNEHFHY